jgi:hypothetical protein
MAAGACRGTSKTTEYGCRYASVCSDLPVAPTGLHVSAGQKTAPAKTTEKCQQREEKKERNTGEIRGV